MQKSATRSIIDADIHHQTIITTAATGDFSGAADVFVSSAITAENRPKSTGEGVLHHTYTHAHTRFIKKHAP